VDRFRNAGRRDAGARPRFEGYSPEEVTFPIRVLGRLGITTLIVTNAAGGIRSISSRVRLVLISDHINFSAGSCFRFE